MCCEGDCGGVPSGMSDVRKVFLMSYWYGCDVLGGGGGTYWYGCDVRGLWSVLTGMGVRGLRGVLTGIGVRGLWGVLTGIGGMCCERVMECT